MKNRYFLMIMINSLFIGVYVFPDIPIQAGDLGISSAKARFDLLSAAESYLGAPYRFGGLDSRGFDCSGFVYRSFRDALDVLVPRTSERLYNWVKKIPYSEIQPGDLVFFITAGSRISHVGIYTGGGRFIHSQSLGNLTGVMYSYLNEGNWRRNFAGAGRALSWDE